MKRGRPPLPPERRRHVRVTVSLSAEVADAMFTISHQKDEPVSHILNRLLERMLARNRELTAYQNTEMGWPVSR